MAKRKNKKPKTFKVRLPKRSGDTLLHVTAGIEGKWDPTKEEIEEIRDLFVQATYEKGGSVVVTRHGVNVHVVIE
jgi:hypothetical protein